MRPEEKTYTWQLVIVLVVYAVILPISITLTQQLTESPIRFVTALVPIVPVVAGVVVFYRYLLRMDELQRKINLVALGISVGCVGVLTFSIGLLDNAGIPQPSMVWVFPGLIFFWGLGRVFAGRRYA